MNTILSKRNAVRPCRTAADAGLLRPDLHFFVALDVKAEVIEPDRLFFSLVQAPGSNIRQKQKSMLGPSVRLFSCLRHASRNRRVAAGPVCKGRYDESARVRADSIHRRP